MFTDERLHSIKLLVLDVDGVMTDGRTWQDVTGAWRRAFSVRDSMGIRALRKAGYRVAVVTSAKAKDIRDHVSLLSLDAFIEDCTDKRSAIESLVQALSLKMVEVACVSEDVSDLPLLRACGCGITVPSSSQELRSSVSYVTKRSGGDGAVLEVCNLILYGNKSKTSGQGRQAAL